MQCPVDGATLSRSTRSGVEIDHCPTCRGVWLDRGELDKILAREQAGGFGEEAAAPPDAPAEAPRRDAGDDARGAASAAGQAPPIVPHGDDRRPYGDKLGEWQARDEAAHRTQRRKGVLEDLFDF